MPILFDPAEAQSAPGSAPIAKRRVAWLTEPI
jgi:hypothetical protein